jgi:hypothetical protein
MAALSTRAPTASGLGTTAARLGIVFVWLTGVARGVIEPPVNDLVRTIPCYLLVLVSGFLLTVPGSRRLDPWRAAGVAAVAVIVPVTVLPGSTVPAQTSPDVWVIDISAYLAALMIARGNVLAGWTGGALQAGAVIAWSLAAAPSAGASLLSHGVSALIVGTIWRFVLASLVRREQLLSDSSARDALAADALERATANARAELGAIVERARPALERVASGDALTPVERWEIAAVEAEIRDRIRSPELSGAVVVRAAADARRRQVDVVLLGDSASPSDRLSDALAARVADAIDATDRGRISVRVLPPGRAGAVSIVVDRGDGGASRRLLDADGRDALEPPLPASF